MCMARFSARPPPRLSRCRTVLPLLAGTGLVPPRAAKAASCGTFLGLSCPEWARRADSMSHVANAAERAGFGNGHAACRARSVIPRQRCSHWLAVFQDQPEFAEVLCHCCLDLGGRERGCKPQHGLGGIEFHVVD